MSASVPHNRPSFTAQEAEAAARVIRSGHVAAGPEVRALESELAGYLGIAPDQVVLVNSGSAALLLALKAAPDVVSRAHIPVYGCSAPLDAAMMAGVPVDLIDSQDEWPGADWRQAVATAGTVQIAVDHFGLPSPLPDSPGSRVIADCAQSFGAQQTGVPTCLRTGVGVISLSPTKIMTVGGPGGALVGTDREWLAAARDYLDWDARSDSRRRFNLELGDVQAAVGRVQLQRLPGFIERRRAILAGYREAGIPILMPAAGDTSSGYRAVVQRSDATRVVAALQSLGVAAILPYADSEMRGRGLPQAPRARRWSRSLVSLPVFPDMSDEQVDRVIDAWNRAVARA